MRDINIKKSNSTLKIILVIALAAGLPLALALLGLGILAWQVFKLEPGHTPERVPTIPPPADRPPVMVPDAFGTKPAAQGGPLQSLPTPRPFDMDLSPPPKPHKRFEFTAVRTLNGHAGMIVAVALSPDEHRGLSGGWDNTLRLWDLDNGKELAKLQGHTNPVRGVTFTPDGRRAVSASLDGTLRLWDLEKKSTIRIFKGHEGSALCVAITPDGNKLLSGGNDRALRIWDVATGKQLQACYGHDGDVTCVSISPNGTTALTGSADGGSTHWDLHSGRELAYLSFGKPVSFALFAADGKRAILGGDAPARLCDLSTGEQWPELPPDDQPARAAAGMPEDNFFLQATGKSLQARFFSMRHVHPGTIRDPRWNLLGEVEAHNGTITSVCTSHNGKLALTASEDGTVKLWRIHEHEGGDDH